MAKHTFKVLRCEHRKIFKVCLAIFQHYEKKELLIVFYSKEIILFEDIALLQRYRDIAVI